MRGFAQRHTVSAALVWLDAQLCPLDAEVVLLRTAAGRVLATSAVSSVDVPGFDRATMDGYAVVADSTEGATAYTGLPLTVIGDSMPGRPFEGSVSLGEAVRIMTGAPIPRGADSVLPAEWVEAEPGNPRRINALAAVSPGKNLGRRGEDIVQGATLLEPGRVLRPQDLGVLSSIGQGEVSVIQRPRVRLAITGNELLPSGSHPRDSHIADANGPMLAALIERDGGLVDFPGLVHDDRDSILEALHADADIVIVSGGSSVGIEDLAPSLVAECGELAVHGIAMRPSSPTGTRSDRQSPCHPASWKSRVQPLRVRFLRGPCDSRARRTQQGMAIPCETRPVDPQDKFADRPPRLCSREDQRGAGRADLRRRSVSAFVDDACGWLRDRWRRQ